MAGNLARAIWSIPVVASTSERDLLYPTPERDQRVQLRTTGDIQRYTGVAWVTDQPAATVLTPETGAVDLRYPFGNVKRYGAVGDGVTNDRAAIQAAWDAVAGAAAAVGDGGEVYYPPGVYRIVESGGVGIVMRHLVTASGAGRLTSVMRFEGTWTNSMIRADFRDDNVPDRECNTGLRDLGLWALSASAVWCLDTVGCRNSTFDNLWLEGNGVDKTGQVAINVGEWNPAHTSRKSCFFNHYSNIKGGGTGWGTWLRFDADSNTGNNIFTNHSSYSRIMIDNSDSTEGLGSVFNRGYHLGDNHATSTSFKLPGGSLEMKTRAFGVFINWDWEFFQVQPTGSNATRAFRVDQPQAAEMARLQIRDDGYFSIAGTDSPLLPGDLSDAFVVSGLACVNGAAGTVVLNPGVAYNRHRAALTGGSVLTVTNTGAGHTEYVVIDASVESQRSTIRLTAPAATDLALWEVTVSAAGLVTALTDKRIFYPNLQVRGLSGTATRAKNLRGQATFATAATVAVTFAVAEPDAQYYIALSGNANQTFWVTAKGTGGFTLNSSSGASTATVDWILVR